MSAMLDYLQSLLPPWIAKGPLVEIAGKRYQRTVAAFGQVADVFRAEVAQGVRYAMLEECADDALPNHASNSSLWLVRNETLAQLRTYLRGRWEIWRASGTTGQLLAELARLGYPNCKVVSYIDLLVFAVGIAGPFVLNAGIFGANYGFFYVEIDLPNGFGPPVRWDGGEAWDGGALWDLSEPYPGAIADIMATIRKWKPIGRSCRFLRIRIADSGAPDEWVTVPMGELWEYDGDGFAPDYYLTHV